MTVKNTTIDNRERAAMLRLVMYAGAALAVVLVCAGLLFLESPRNALWPWVLAAVVVVAQLMAFFVFKFNYLRIDIDASRLVLRYHSLAPRSRDYRAVEISRRDFEGFELTSHFFGLIPSLTLYARSYGMRARYPAVSVSSLSPAQIEELREALRAFAGKTAAR